jgi:hypothetical protein
MAGLWTLAHEAGHGTLSDYNWVNHVIGYTLHTVSMFCGAEIHRAEAHIVPPGSILRLAGFAPCTSCGGYHAILDMLVLTIVD